MKKRIISFLLALVMLFSCLSLNIFAAESDNAAATDTSTEEEVGASDAAAYQKYGVGLPGKYNLSAAELAAAVTAAGGTVLLNSEFAEDTKNSAATGGWIYKFAGSSLNKNGKADYENIVSVEDGDGDYYLKWQRPLKTDGSGEYATASSEYLDWQGDGLTSGRYEQYKKDGRIGASFAVTFDFKWYGNGAVGQFLSTQRSYTKNDSFEAITTNVNPQVKATGEFVCKKPDGTWQSICYLPADEWVQITLYFTPRGLNGEKDVVYNEETREYDKTADYDDNTYHVFVDGVYYATLQAVLDASVTNWPYTYTDSETGLEVTDHINSASDFTTSYLRVGQVSHKDYDQFAMDDLRIYCGTPVECAHSKVVDGECQWCGDDVTVGVHCVLCDRNVEFNSAALSADAAVANRNIELAESIELNFYLELTDEIRANENAKIVLTGADGKRQEEYAVSELMIGDEESDAPGRYKVMLPLRSIDMASEVTVEVYVGEERVGSRYTMTVAEYLDAVYDDAAYESMKPLIEATLNYGAYAQKYFAEKNETPELDDVLPNEDYELDLSTVDVSALTKENSDYAIKTNGTTAYFNGMSLVLTSLTEMKIYLNTNAVTVTVDREALDVVASGNEWYVTLNGASPAELGTAKTVTFTWSDGSTTTVTVSVYSVLKAILEDADTSEAFKNLATAMYNYGKVAAAYPS